MNASPAEPNLSAPNPPEPVVDPAARALRTRVAAAGLPPAAARPGSAQPGDAIVLVGAIGRGGAAVLALACGPWLRRRVPPADLVQAAAWPGGPGWDIAALAACLEAFPFDEPDAIHACLALGDGGLARGCHAVARASNVALLIDAGAVPLHAGTARICDALGLNPLDVQSAGTLLFTAPPDVAGAAAAHFAAAGHDATLVGRVQIGPCAVSLTMGGSRRPLARVGRDAVDDVLDQRA